MKKTSTLVAVVLLGLLAAACGQAFAPSVESQRNLVQPSVGGAINPVEGLPAEAPAAPGVDTSVSSYSPGSAPPDRIVIQTATLSLVVTDPAARVAAIRAMAEGMGGFVVTSNIYKTAYGSEGLTTDQASITVRVPADRLDEALTQIKQGAVEVRSENVSGEDVTQQYTDLKSRLRNLEAAEARLLSIMAEASKIPDILAVSAELDRVQGEIEVIKGQIQYYDESAALSAISVELIPDEAAQPIKTGSWDPKGTVKNAIEALLKALQWIVDAAIWVAIYVLPVALIVIGIPLVLLRVILRRRRAARPKNDA